MAKLDFGRVLMNLAQTAVGMQQGQIAGQEELRRRQVQQQEIEREQQRQRQATLLSLLPQLGRSSQELVIGHVLGGGATPQNIAGYRGPLGGGQAFQPQMGNEAPTEFAQFVGGLPGPEAIGQTGAAPSTPGAMAAPEPPPSLRGVTGAAPTTLPPGAWQARFTGQTPPERDLLPRPPMPAPPGAAVVPTEAQPRIAPHTERMAREPQAAEVPGAVVTPASLARERGVYVPGIGTLSLRGVDPKEVKGVLDAIGKTRERVFSQAFVKDPNTQATLRSIIARTPKKPVGEWTEDDFEQAKQVQSDLESTALFLGRQNPQIQMELDRAEATQFEKDFPRLSGFRADNLQQELFRIADRATGLRDRGLVQIPSWLAANMDDIALMRDRLAKGDKPGAGLILGLIKQELTPRAKDADPIKALDTLLGQAPRWAGLDPAAQQVFLRRARQAAQDAGLDPSVIPDKLEAVMSDEARERLGISRDQLRLAQQREKRVAAAETQRLALAERNQKRLEAQDRLRLRKQSGNLTEAEQKRVGKIEAARKAQYDRRNDILSKMPVDLAPGTTNPATRAIEKIDKEIDRLNGAIEAILGTAEKRGGGTGAPKTGAESPKADAAARRKADRTKSIDELMKELLEVSK